MLPLQTTLREVAQVMTAARDPWWIIASAAVVLHGVPLADVADVDVLLSPADAQRILPGLGLTAAPGGAHPDFRSEIFAIWRAPPLKVEFMAGFAHCRDGVWRPVWPATRQAVTVLDGVVYVPERDELRRLVESFGRPKDYERARLLQMSG